MNQKDYYAILGVPQTSSADEVKKAYRKLALETHPDRNPGDSKAEERFKLISEAYAVLSDPQKRSQYDQYRRLGGNRQAGPGMYGQSGFGYSQEEIFRDFFKNGGRYDQDVFRDMQREFQRMGFRFDERFINNFFFGGKDFILQGVMWSGPGGVRVFRQSGGQGWSKGEVAPAKPKGIIETGVSLLAKAGKKIGGFLLNKAIGGISSPPTGRRAVGGGSRAPGNGADMTYHLDITSGQATNGGIVQVQLPHLAKGKMVSVRIPAGVRSGVKLRLKEMGNLSSGRRGDLYLALRVV